MCTYVLLILAIVRAFKHILLNVLFPRYFLHACTYHMIKAKEQ
jgi:hypothetical protein